MSSSARGSTSSTKRRVSWRRRPSSWLSTACVFPRRWMYARYAGERRSTDRIGPHHSESQRSTFNCFAGPLDVYAIATSFGPIWVKSLGGSGIGSLALSNADGLLADANGGVPGDRDGILHTLMRRTTLRMKLQRALRCLPRL